MTSPDQMAEDLNQLLSEPSDKKQSDHGVVLAPQLYLDKKIVEEGQAPRLMEVIRDEGGLLLIRKYEKLTKPIWQKYRSKTQCKPLHFVSESPLFIVEDINATYLLPDDFQFLGAHFNQIGNDAIADQFFNEALKSATADAYINAGVFRYNRGDQGVIDNFYVAKKHFNKALAVLHNQLSLTIDERRDRRKLLVEALDEIDYRFAPWFDKFFRFIIRLLTFHFETVVPYVGPASPKVAADVKLKEMTDGILRREFEIKKEAAMKFVSDLHEKIPVGQSHLESELQEIETEYGGFPSPEMLEIGVIRIGEFYAQNLHLLERGISGDAAGAGEKAGSSAVRTAEEICFDLAGFEDIEKVASKYKLTSINEIMDMAGRANIDKVVMAWMIRDKMGEPVVMEKLASNPSVPEDIKALIRQTHSF